MRLSPHPSPKVTRGIFFFSSLVGLHGLSSVGVVDVGEGSGYFFAIFLK